MNEFLEIPASKASITKRKLIFGVGVNDANYIVQPTINNKRISCPYYSVWINMLKRCYSANYQAKYLTYKDCTVDKDWLIFSNFKDWMIQQEHIGLALDKDILIKGNKHYSIDTCLFVSQHVNCLIRDSTLLRGKSPLGVTWCKTKKKYKASYTYKNSNNHIGYFDNEDDAHKNYLAFKKKLLLECANEQTNTKVKNALIKIANTY